MSVHLKNEKGKPTFYISNRPTPPIIYGLSDFPGASANTHYAYRNIQNFAEQGINIVMADSALHLGWHKRFPFDPEAIISEIEAVLDANPIAKVLLRLHMNPPYWWIRDNPEECVVYRTPEGDLQGLDDGEQDRLIRLDAKQELRVSFASKKWIKEASEKLELFLSAIQGTRACNALMGVQIAYGLFGEWHSFGIDVSQPMKEYFRNFLIEKYKTVDELRRAWRDDKVDFDTAEYHPEPFAPSFSGRFRDPAYSQNVIDAQMSNQKAGTDAILHFAKVVKLHSPAVLCGTFYGYTFWGGERSVITGHLNVKVIQQSQYIDYLCGPFCYGENRKPDEIPMQRSLLESHRLHGKLWLTEMDQFPLGVEIRSGGTEEKFNVNVSLLRREALKPIFAGQGFWYYDHRLVPTLKIVQDMGNTCSDVTSIYRKRGWWDSSEMMNEIGNIQKFAEDFCKRDYVPLADVLVIHDAEAKYYHKVVDRNSVEYQLFKEITRCGSVYDCIYLSDFEICDTKRYKCLIFADCPNITPKMREIINEKTQGKTCLFLYGSGYSDSKALSCDAISKTVGMNVKITHAKSITSVYAEDISLDEMNIDPFFCVTDEASEALAYFDNGTKAVAKLGNKVYASLLTLPFGLVKKILGDAGVHFWCESGDPVYAASGYILINCQKAGRREIFLPNGERIEIVSDGYDTMVFDLETKERVL